MGESRADLLNWVNTLLEMNYTKIEQLGTGAALCQIIDSIYGEDQIFQIILTVTFSTGSPSPSLSPTDTTTPCNGLVSPSISFLQGM